jgi:hypothetical protein
MRWNALGQAAAHIGDAYEYLVEYVTKVHKPTAPGVVHLCDGCLQEGDGVGLFRLLLQPRMQGGPKASEGRSKYQGCTEFLGIPEGTTLTVSCQGVVPHACVCDSISAWPGPG